MTKFLPCEAKNGQLNLKEVGKNNLKKKLNRIWTNSRQLKKSNRFLEVFFNKTILKFIFKLKKLSFLF